MDGLQLDRNQLAEGAMSSPAWSVASIQITIAECNSSLRFQNRRSGALHLQHRQ